MSRVVRKKIVLPAASPVVISIAATLVVAGCAIVNPEKKTNEAEKARLEAVERQRLADERWKQQQRDEQARRLAQERAKPQVAPELANAMRVGRYNCELNRRVDIVSKLPDDGGVMLRWKRKDYELRAVQSKTGALRLEDQTSGLVWITIVGKSMLFDSKNGRQLANECRL